MQNDMLKNTIAPWQEKGRWYHGIVDIPARSIIQNKSDTFINTLSVGTANNTLILRLPTGYSFIDVKYKLSDDFRRSSSGYIPYGYYHYIDGPGLQYPSIAPDGTAGTSEFWVFIVEK